MKIVNTGNIFHLYDDTLKTFDKLPAQAYLVGFNNQTGFYLETFNDIEVNEKIYGIHTEKVNKVFKSFQAFERNMGIILSGAKGIGKSLFAKLLSIKAVENGFPLIIVNTPYPGIANFLTSITQEVFVMFDEFDKTFKTSHDGDFDPQADMLSLFDGMSMGKKCFIVTCNEFRKLNDFLVNRPGRFHYHFRFNYPQGDEIREYLADKLQPEYHMEIESVVNFATKVDLNYDCLRAIAFELNLGISFSEAIKDLNIVNTELDDYMMTIVFKDGTKCKAEKKLDLFSDIDEDIKISSFHKDQYFCIEFSLADIIQNAQTFSNTVAGSDIRITYVDEDTLKPEETPEDWRANNPIDYMIISRKRSKELHYAV